MDKKVKIETSLIDFNIIKKQLDKYSKKIADKLIKKENLLDIEYTDKNEYFVYILNKNKKNILVILKNYSKNKTIILSGLNDFIKNSQKKDIGLYNLYKKIYFELLIDEI